MKNRLRNRYRLKAEIFGLEHTIADIFRVYPFMKKKIAQKCARKWVRDPKCTLPIYIDRRYQHKYYPSKPVQKLIRKPKFNDLKHLNKQCVRKYTCLIKTNKQDKNKNGVEKNDILYYFNQEQSVNNNEVFENNDSDDEVFQDMQNDDTITPMGPMNRKRQISMDIMTEEQPPTKKRKVIQKKKSDKREMDASDDEQ
eukprot:471566_1